MEVNIKDGYKITEVGVIPDDWEVKKLGDIADVKTGPFGSSLHEKDYVDDGIPIITVEHLSDKGVVHKNLPMVSDFDKNRLSSYILKTGDIVFSRVGSVDRNSLISELENGWLFSSRLLRIRINIQNISPAYLSYHFLQESTKHRIRSVAVGQTMASLNTTILKGIDISLPPLSEQKAIAHALSDVDNLITAIDQLITKKRNIKQGTMQQLLTGKKRLPGFSGEWEVRKLGDIGSFYSGGTPNTSNSSFYGGNIVWITSGDLNNKRVRHVDGRITQKGLENSSAKIVYKNTLLMAMYGATAGVIAITEIEGAINQAILAIILNNDCIDFFFHKLTSIKEWIIKTYTQGGQPNLSGNIVKSIQLLIPPLPEQKAIAEILSDIDKEIEALEKNRDKYKAIKQGMMQELLTGKTRLKIKVEDREI